MAKTFNRGIGADWNVFAAWTDLLKTAVETQASAFQIWSETYRAMVANSLGFATERAVLNSEGLQQMMCCGSPADLVEIQRKLSEQAWVACRDETEFLAELAESGFCAIAREAKGSDRLRLREETEAA